MYRTLLPIMACNCSKGVQPRAVAGMVHGRKLAQVGRQSFPNGRLDAFPRTGGEQMEAADDPVGNDSRSLFALFKNIENPTV